MADNTPKASAPRLNRRQFLKLIGLSGLSAFLAQCRPFRTLSPASTVIPASPSIAATTTPVSTGLVPTAVSSYKAVAAIDRLENYDPAGLKSALEHMLAGIGGLGDLVKPGAHVGIKPNLTGGPAWDSALPIPAAELFVTHPALIGELVKLFYEAGAGKVTILEGLGDERNFAAWGYTSMARSVGADLIDLCKPYPYSSFQAFPVQPKPNIYDSFNLNPILNEIHVFVSVAKMKCHAIAGVTLSLKNLFGIVPTGLYKRDEADTNRSAFHDTGTFDRRIPRVIIDLNIARPIHLAVIDGILTAEGGEGPWLENLSPVHPGLLVASKDPVAADAVATALMGFDPAGESGKLPYTHGENHIALAAAAGLGTNRLEEIGIFGPSIESARFSFKPVD